MSRATRFILYSLPLFIFYLLALADYVQIPLISKEASDAILPTIPWWLLVSFGAYSLGSLGLGLLRFRDCPEAYTSLMREISEAKDDLRARGVAVD